MHEDSPITRQLDEIRNKLDPLIALDSNSLEAVCAQNVLQSSEQQGAAIEQLQKLRLILGSMISFIDARIPTLLRCYVEMEDVDGMQKLLNDYTLTKSTAEQFLKMSEMIIAICEQSLETIQERAVEDIVFIAAQVSFANAIIQDKLNPMLDIVDNKLSDIFATIWTSILVSWCHDEYGSLLSLMETIEQQDDDPLQFG